ncbi:FkbM family methyltransferase [Telmatobacter sp. DSM 110680]|uniref:FkbM family methyltransferase n=1 Tax=Telmatobacter sp. DSM 110680 TaxID=3036704 RepID=A0AAU7DEN9_9BACT
MSLRLDTTDMRVFDDVLVKEDYAFGLPSSAKVIVDAGANIGMTSLFYAYKFPSAKIFAVEPELSNFNMLRKNVRAYHNILPIHAALWHSEGRISVSTSPDEAFGHWGFVVSANPGDVSSITIPSLMRDFGLDYIDLLKVNIEGSEKEVFEACQWQDRIGSVVIELHDHFKSGCTDAVNHALRDFSRSASGYLTWYRRESHGAQV